MFSSINDVNIKIEELKSKGILSDFNFKDNLFNSPTDNNSVNTTGLFSYEQRPFVLANINGKQVPFYQSTGSGGKKNVPAGTWYPVVGMAEDGWIMKGSEEEINTFYGIKEFEDTALNTNLTSGIQIDMKLINFDGVNYLDYRKTVQSIMAYKMADVDNITLVYSFYESLSEFICNYVNEIANDTKAKDVVLCGNMFANSILLSKTNKTLSKTYNILLPKEYPLDY